jgi:hypothetical protein
VFRSCYGRLCRGQTQLAVDDLAGADRYLRLLPCRFPRYPRNLRSGPPQTKSRTNPLRDEELGHAYEIRRVPHHLAKSAAEVHAQADIYDISGADCKFFASTAVQTPPSPGDLRQPKLITSRQLLAVTIYTALAYGLLYLTLFAYPFSFTTVRNWAPQLATLPFLSILTGFMLGLVLIEIFFNPWWKRRLAARTADPMNANKNPVALVSPEDRLPPMFFASVLLPMGLFWFAWTSSPTLNYWPQVLSGIFIGMGITGIFVSSVSYLVDVYLLNANSALAANAFLRALFAAAFPLFAKYLYQRLGVDWATSLIGFLAVAMIPFPFLFWFKGKQIRGWSKFSFDL